MIVNVCTRIWATDSLRSEIIASLSTSGNKKKKCKFHPKSTIYSHSTEECILMAYALQNHRHS